MTDRIHFVSLHFYDEPEDAEAQLIQMRLASRGSFDDPEHRNELHRLLDAIITEFQLLESGEA